MLFLFRIHEYYHVFMNPIIASDGNRGQVCWVEFVLVSSYRSVSLSQIKLLEYLTCKPFFYYLNFFSH